MSGANTAAGAMEVAIRAEEGIERIPCDWAQAMTWGKSITGHSGKGRAQRGLYFIPADGLDRILLSTQFHMREDIPFYRNFWSNNSLNVNKRSVSFGTDTHLDSRKCSRICSRNMLVSAASQISICCCRHNAHAPTHIHNLRASAAQFIKSENKTWLVWLLNNTAEAARAAPFPWCAWIDLKPLIKLPGKG